MVTVFHGDELSSRAIFTVCQFDLSLKRATTNEMS